MAVTHKVLTKTLEYNIIEHCNLSCRGCSHLSPHFPYTRIEPKEFAADINRMANLLHATELKIIGGEPLLHPELPRMLSIARAAKIADCLTISTNGTLLDKMADTVWAQVDRLRISLYPGVTLGIPLAQLRQLAADHAVDLVIDEVAFFKHTILDRKNEDVGLVSEIFSECAMPAYFSCHTLRHGILYKCSPSAYIPAVFSEVRFAADGLEIHDEAVDGAAIERFLATKKQLSTCAYCLGTSGKTFACRQEEVKPRSRPARGPEASELVSLFRDTSDSSPFRAALVKSYRRRALL